MANNLPDDWKYIRLRDVLRESKTRVRTSKGIPVYSVTNSGGFRPSGEYFSKQVHSEDTSNYKVVQEGQFAYNPSRINVGSIDMLTGQSTVALSPMYVVFAVDSAQMLTSYLRQWIRSERFLQLVDTSTQGTVRDSLSFEALGSFRIPLPPLREQRAIVDTLGAVDEAIARTQAVIEQLRVAKYWQMRELLTLGHPRFRTALQPITEPWPVGRVAPDITMQPQHWHLVTLTDVARLESGHTPSREHPEYWGGDIPWISLQDTDQLTNLVVTETAEMVTGEGIANSSARILPKDTVVLLRTASVGLCSRMGRPMSTSQHYANWLCSERLDARYLVQVFRHMDREWKRLSAGSVLPDVYMHTFNRVKVLLPPVDEQCAIADIGEAYDLRIKAESDYLEQLTEAKRALAQRLLSGAIHIV